LKRNISSELFQGKKKKFSSSAMIRARLQSVPTELPDFFIDPDRITVEFTSFFKFEYEMERGGRPSIGFIHSRAMSAMGGRFNRPGLSWRARPSVKVLELVVDSRLIDQETLQCLLGVSEVIRAPNVADGENVFFSRHRVMRSGHVEEMLWRAGGEFTKLEDLCIRLTESSYLDLIERQVRPFAIYGSACLGGVFEWHPRLELERRIVEKIHSIDPDSFVLVVAGQRRHDIWNHFIGSVGLRRAMVCSHDSINSIGAIRRTQPWDVVVYDLVDGPQVRDMTEISRIKKSRSIVLAQDVAAIYWDHPTILDMIGAVLKRVIGLRPDSDGEFEAEDVAPLSEMVARGFDVYRDFHRIQQHCVRFIHESLIDSPLVPFCEQVPYKESEPQTIRRLLQLEPVLLDRLDLIDNDTGFLKNAATKALEEDQGCDCGVCFTSTDSERTTLAMLACGHKICIKCLLCWSQERVAAGHVFNCPYCRSTSVSVQEIFLPILRFYGDEYQSEHTSSDLGKEAWLLIFRLTSRGRVAVVDPEGGISGMDKAMDFGIVDSSRGVFDAQIIHRKTNVYITGNLAGLKLYCKVDFVVFTSYPLFSRYARSFVGPFDDVKFFCMKPVAV
jgi:hypothetical protein